MRVTSSTTLYDIDIDGKKHRVIPRDYQLDPVKDFPIHVDFMRLAPGSLIRVNVPVHVINTDQSPGVKRGGAVNIVTHAIPLRCPPDASRSRSRSTSQASKSTSSKHLQRCEAAGRREAGRARGHDPRHHRAAVRLWRRGQACRSCCCSAAAAPARCAAPALRRRWRQKPAEKAGR